jgi:hypothetical protein
LERIDRSQKVIVMDTSKDTMFDEVAKPPVKVSVSALQAKLSRSVQNYSNTSLPVSKKSTRSTLLPSRVQQSVSRLTLREARGSRKLTDRSRTEATPARRPLQSRDQHTSLSLNKRAVNQQANVTPGNPSVTAVNLNHPAMSGPNFTQRIIDRLSQKNRNRPSVGTHTPQSSNGSMRDFHIAPKSMQPKKSGFKAAPDAAKRHSQTDPGMSAVIPRVHLDRVSRSNMTQQQHRRPESSPTLIDGPQQQYEKISFSTRLQKAVSSVPPPHDSAAARGANGVHEVAGWGGSLNVETGQRSNEGHRPVAENAEMSSPEASESSVQQQSDPHQFGMPMANQFVGWDKTMQGIADARTNNKPKQPLRRIR